MLNDRVNKINDLFDRLKDELFTYHNTQGIEYRDYKKRMGYYYPEERKLYEIEFYEFPFSEINISNEIKIFHTFYETDVWGISGPVKIGSEELRLSMLEIEKNVALDKPEFIYRKLQEKYIYLEEDIPKALNGFKKHLQLKEDHPEEYVLVNLLNQYNKLLNSKDTQLNIFEEIYFNKEISDIYTELLKELVEYRLQILKPEITQYKKQGKRRVILKETESLEEIPLIKLNYNPDQQKQLIKLLFDNLHDEYIDDEYEQFERHFHKTQLEFQKSVWKGSEPEIAHLFKSLKDCNIIVSRDQNKLIELHFLNKKGEPFKNKQLRVTHSKTTIETFPVINHLVKDLKKLALTFN